LLQRLIVLETMINHAWLLFLPQLPSSPSSLRVLVWRRLRAAGALGLQNGVWVLPHTPDQERVLQDLLGEVTPQGGNGLIFVAAPLAPEVQDTIIARFRADRDREYTEFCTRCQDLLAEIAKETSHQKFTFAELEETEQDLQRLTDWLRKIQNRDFFGGQQAAAASAALAQCEQAMRDFTAAVYAHEGLDPHVEGPEPGAP
jgi:hypothetical protein